MSLCLQILNTVRFTDIKVCTVRERERSARWRDGKSRKERGKEKREGEIKCARDILNKVCFTDI